MSRDHIPRAVRERVAAQAGHRCGYCLTSGLLVGSPFEMDHILPESLGGTTEEDNLWLACPLCNGHKSNRISALDPLTGEEVRLFDPRRQTWSEHFAWADSGDRVIGLTPCGRATVVAVQLNRSALVHARRAWVAVGWHPPKD